MQYAAMAIGELSGIGRTLPNPYLLIRPFQRIEAVASSNIEGTVTSLSDLFLFEEGADEKKRPPDTREVYNYVKALQSGIDQLTRIPLCLRMLCNVHSVLLDNVEKHRGAHIPHGEFRHDQNWIGGRTARVARFVPPPVNELGACLDSFEKFLHDEAIDLPPLIKIALIHYQFETIHPFPDGNGRVGRLLIPLYLCEKKVMPQPLLYMSTYFEKYRDEYIDKLYAVSEHGDWISWIDFFLQGILEQSKYTISRIRSLQDLHMEYRNIVAKARASAILLKLCDIIFERPFITIPRVAEEFNITYRAAKINVDKLINHEILTEVEIDTRVKYFCAQDVFSIIHN